MQRVLKHLATLVTVTVVGCDGSGNGGGGAGGGIAVSKSVAELRKELSETTKQMDGAYAEAAETYVKAFEGGRLGWGWSQLDDKMHNSRQFSQETRAAYKQWRDAKIAEDKSRKKSGVGGGAGNRSVAELRKEVSETTKQMDGAFAASAEDLIKGFEGGRLGWGWSQLDDQILNSRHFSQETKAAYKQWRDAKVAEDKAKK